MCQKSLTRRSGTKRGWGFQHEPITPWRGERRHYPPGRKCPAGHILRRIDRLGECTPQECQIQQRVPSSLAASGHGVSSLTESLGASHETEPRVPLRGGCAASAARTQFPGQRWVLVRTPVGQAGAGVTKPRFQSALSWSARSGAWGELERTAKRRRPRPPAAAGPASAPA